MQGARLLATAFVFVCVFSGCGRTPHDFQEPPAETYSRTAWEVTTDSFSEKVEGAAVSPEFFPASKVLPYLGRFFYVEDHAAGWNGVVVLSHQLWQRRFGSEPAVIGRQIQLDGRSVVIIGVGPPEFAFPNGVEVWAPKT